MHSKRWYWRSLWIIHWLFYKVEKMIILFEIISHMNKYITVSWRTIWIFFLWVNTSHFYFCVFYFMIEVFWITNLLKSFYIFFSILVTFFFSWSNSSFCHRKKNRIFLFRFTFWLNKSRNSAGRRYNAINVRKENELKYDFAVHVGCVLFAQQIKKYSTNWTVSSRNPENLNLIFIEND